jgi:hypothetical protein
MFSFAPRQQRQRLIEGPRRSKLTFALQTNAPPPSASIGSGVCVSQ